MVQDVYKRQIENIGLSCPAFASWLVSLNHKCKLIEQVYYENSAEINKNYVKTEAEIIMQSVIERFYEKNSVEESIVACYSMFGADETLSIISDFSEKYSLLLQNISICYLFERIMLQSKKEKPDYIAAVSYTHLLPLYADLELKQVDRISEIVNKAVEGEKI